MPICQTQDFLSLLGFNDDNLHSALSANCRTTLPLAATHGHHVDQASKKSSPGDQHQEEGSNSHTMTLEAHLQIFSPLLYMIISVDPL